MKRSFLIIIIFLFANFYTQAQGFLQQKGKAIINGKGKKADRYTISFKTASATDGGLLSMIVGNKIVVKDLPVNNTGDAQNWQWLTVKDIFLQTGTHSFRVLAGKGGFNFAAIQFDKQ